jgi:hypothetical protein
LTIGAQVANLPHQSSVHFWVKSTILPRRRFCGVTPIGNGKPMKSKPLLFVTTAATGDPSYGDAQRMPESGYAHLFAPGTKKPGCLVAPARMISGLSIPIPSIKKCANQTGVARRSQSG